MHGIVQGTGNGAIEATPDIGSEIGNAPTSGSDPDEWFPQAAWCLLGTKDTGQLLHYATGKVYPLSSCYAYVAKDPDKRRAVPDHLIRKLIHSEQGEPWHNAYMGGCRAKWWVKRKAERRLAELARSIFAQLQIVMEEGNEHPS